MTTRTLLLLWLCAGLQASCSTGNFYQGIYEGNRIRNNLETTPSERAREPEAPAWRDYEKMRKDRASTSSGN